MISDREVPDAKARQILQLVIDLISDCMESAGIAGLDWRQLRAVDPDGSDSFWRIEVAPGILKGPEGFTFSEKVCFDPLPLLGLFEADGDLESEWNDPKSYFFVKGRLKDNGLLIEVVIFGESFDDAEPGYELHEDGTITELRRKSDEHCAGEKTE